MLVGGDMECWLVGWVGGSMLRLLSIFLLSSNSVPLLAVRHQGLPQPFGPLVKSHIKEKPAR